FQEAEVVTEEVANVVNAVFQDRNTFGPHTKGKAAEHFRVIAPITEHLGMDHTGTQNLQPASLLAHGTTLATADDAVHIDLNARLGKGEMAAAKAHLAGLTKHTTCEGDQDTFQVSHGNVRPHSQTLDLVEHEFVSRGDCLVAVAHARQDHP